MSFLFYSMEVEECAERADAFRYIHVEFKGNVIRESEWLSC